MKMVEALKIKSETYKKIPTGIKEVLELFHSHSLSYLLLKCEHILAGENKNLDLLLETDEEYARAASLLQERGFALRMSEKVEKYKSMYCGFYEGVMYSIHLHREVAWHGMKALDKKELFQRKKTVNGLIVLPSVEDSILIHAGHVLFENFQVTGREKVFLDQMEEEGIGKIDREYIKKQIENNHWKKGFWKVMKIKDSSRKLGVADLVPAWSGKLFLEPTTLLYLLKKAAKIPWRGVDPRRKGVLISLVGVNGSGKSTLARELLKRYEQPLAHLGKKREYYYFGWKPAFFLTKMISAGLRKKNKKLFEENVVQTELKRFNGFQELSFVYQWLEFYYRYWTEVWPKLRKGTLVVTDRYFYDLYGQYPYARNSLALPFLIKIFPHSDYTFLLDADVKTLQGRKKVNKENIKEVEQGERKVLPEEYLQSQRENYFRLKEKLDLKLIDTNEDLDKNADFMIQETWRSLL